MLYCNWGLEQEVAWRNFGKDLHEPLEVVKERTGKQQVVCCRDGSETLDFEK